MTENNKADIVCVTETWFSDSIPPCVTDIDGDTCERRGVLTYIRNSIPCHRLSILECDEVETLWLPVRDNCMPRNFSHILVAVIYHPLGDCRIITINHIITSINNTI